MAQLAFEHLRPVPSANRITDFQQFGQLFTKWDGRFEQLSSGRFEGAVLVSHGERLTALSAATNQVLMAHGQDVPGQLHFMLVLPQAALSHFQKSRLEVGSIVVVDDSIAIDHRSSKLAAYLGLRAEEKTIRSIVRTDHLSEPGNVGWFACQPMLDEFSRLEINLRRFLAAAQDPTFVGTQDGRQLEQHCLVTAVAATFPAKQRRRIEMTYSSRARLVRKTEAIMRGRIGIPTGELDLCNDLGVSGRTLRQAFREQFGMGPMTFFQALRLNAARTVLKAATDSDAGAVSAIAQSVGFHHPGKFAGYYRRLFGELPSHTIQSDKKVINSQPTPHYPGPAGRTLSGVARRH